MRRYILALLAVFALFAPAAHAVQILDFYGICSVGCTGLAQGELVLSDSYVFGDLLVSGDLLSLRYYSNNFHFFVSAPDLSVVSGGPVDCCGSLAGEFYLVGLGGEQLELAADYGTWFARSSSGGEDAGYPGALVRLGLPGCQQIPFEHESFCPEPATLALCSIALVGMGFSRRRKQS